MSITPNSNRPRALIIGGSMSGLFSAALLARQGWDVDVFERSNVELAGRGAGISTHPELMRALHLAGVSTDNLGVPVEHRIVIDLAGNIIHEYPLRETMTSWDRLQRLLRQVIPSDRYHLGQNYIGFEQTETQVIANFENGRREKADLLIGADGFRSAVRNQLLPDLRPCYAGYVVWRGAPMELNLPKSVIDGIFKHFTIALPPRQQVVGYPIPGIGDDNRPGHRRYNFIWYRVIDDAALVDLCTDATGKLHQFSIAPPLIRDEVIAAMRSDAQKNMPPQFLAVLARIERPFFTPIYDLVAPRLAFGRVALVGDFGLRLAAPHGIRRVESWRRRSGPRTLTWRRTRRAVETGSIQRRAPTGQRKDFSARPQTGGLFRHRRIQRRGASDGRNHAPAGRYRASSRRTPLP